jgi:hypothetical protein
MLACGTRPDARADYLESVARAEAPLEDAWREFDEAIARSGWPAAREAARRGSAAAAAARDFLERLRVPPSLATARREELIFLNHAFLGFQGFAAREANAVDLAKLKSILQRGRTHQRRGREAV